MESQEDKKMPPQGGVWNQIKQYLFLKKRDPNEPRSVNIFLMHGMNRISILLFIICIIIMLVRLFTKR